MPHPSSIIHISLYFATHPGIHVHTQGSGGDLLECYRRGGGRISFTLSQSIHYLSTISMAGLALSKNLYRIRIRIRIALLGNQAPSRSRQLQFMYRWFWLEELSTVFTHYVVHTVLSVKPTYNRVTKIVNVWYRTWSIINEIYCRGEGQSNIMLTLTKLSN